VDFSCSGFSPEGGSERGEYKEERALEKEIGGKEGEIQRIIAQGVIM